MNQMTVGQFKAKFSESLEKVLRGESVGITYGRNKKRVAALVPYKKFMNTNSVKLGLLEGKASFKLRGDFKITDEEFLAS